MAESTLAFTKVKINGLVLPNRIMRSATYEALADENGCPTQRQIDHYVKLARGGCGLIVAGATYVHPKGRGHRFQAGFVNDEQTSAWNRAFVAVHKAHGLICVQLNHDGLDAREKFNGGFIPQGASATSPRNRAMSESEIEEVIDSFVSAGKRAFAAGADAIQLHAAHGYLLAEFLSPLWNKRDDHFGGDAARRFEIVRRILVGLRQSLPSSFPILIKMNGHDVEPGGVTVDIAAKTAKMAEAAGVDAIEISGGSGRKPYSVLGDMPIDELFTDPKKREAMKKKLSDIKFTPMFNHEYCKKIKESVRVPIISVGGFRRLEDINNAIMHGECDIVAMSRPFIKNPSLVNEMMHQHNSNCTNCNRCFFKTLADSPVHCWLPN